jgi:hypothetical protein
MSQFRQADRKPKGAVPSSFHLLLYSGPEKIK